MRSIITRLNEYGVCRANPCIVTTRTQSLKRNSVLSINVFVIVRLILLNKEMLLQRIFEERSNDFGNTTRWKVIKNIIELPIIKECKRWRRYL